MGRNHYGITTGKKNRLSVCLKRFFSDERARCYITADVGLRFRWLAARMRRLFGLHGPFCLVTRGHLLPPDEPVGLLDADDLVEVIPKHHKIFPDTSESDVSERSNESDIEHEANEKQVNKVPAECRDKPGHKEEHEVQKLSNLPCQSSSVDVSNFCLTAITENQELQKEKNEIVLNRNSDDVDSGQFEGADKEKLDERKRKALELLDKFSVPAKRKRKRVRRRKQHAFIQEPAAVCEGPDSRERVTESQTNTALANGIPGKSTSPGLVEADTLVLRNNTEHSRTARLVHSLS